MRHVGPSRPSASRAHWGCRRAAYIRGTMTTLRFAILSLALVLAACSDGDSEIAAQREATRAVATDSRARAADIQIIRTTALPARHADAEVADVEEVAAALDDIPAQARALRAAKAVRDVEVRLAPQPIVVGPYARGDLALDNTAPLDTIRNAVEGSALVYSAIRSEGVIVADIVAARFEDEVVTLYLATRQ